eukprot:272901_1
MSTSPCCSDKMKHFKIIPLILLAAILYIIISSTNPILLFSMFNMKCSDDEYSNTYYKTQWHDYNCTYNIYAIKIGKIYSQYLSQTQIKNISHSISKHLLFLPDKMYHASTTAEGRIRKQLYHKYYNNFHHTSTSQCQSKHDSESVHKIDFFKFIQTDAKYTNNP